MSARAWGSGAAEVTARKNRKPSVGGRQLPVTPSSGPPANLPSGSSSSDGHDSAGSR